MRLYDQIVSGNGRTNQEVREVQSPGAGSAVVLHGAKEAVTTYRDSCVGLQVFLFPSPVMINCATEIRPHVKVYDKSIVLFGSITV